MRVARGHSLPRPLISQTGLPKAPCHDLTLHCGIGFPICLNGRQGGPVLHNQKDMQLRSSAEFDRIRQVARSTADGLEPCLPVQPCIREFKLMTLGQGWAAN